MKSTGLTQPTSDVPPVGVATARMLLELALQNEAALEAAEHPDVTRRRSLNELTGSSILLPPKVVTEEP